MKVSDYIVEFFISKEITDVFGYPGGMVTHLMESFDKYKSKITAHVNYHEQASAFSACGYAQLSHKPGVAYATSGPGATNLITGIANAYFDSIPTIFLTGQVNSYESKGNLKIRQKGFQETDIVNIVRTITKYAVQIESEKDIRYELEKAYAISMEGRPGPVLIDIPMNIQRQDICVEQLHGYEADVVIEEDITKFDIIIDELKKSKRPCLLVGAGIKSSGTTEKFRRLTDILNIPVVSSMIAFDTIPSNSENYYGFVGAYGHRIANFILSKGDLIISIGSRLDCRQTGNEIDKFAPNAKLLRVDVDTNELENRIKADELQINTNLSSSNGFTYITEKLEQTDLPNFNGWTKVCDEIKNKLLYHDHELSNQFIQNISKVIPDDVVITTDVGQNQVWVAQDFMVKEKQQILFSGGHGAMGYSLPAAIGAYYGSRKNVISFNGDGGFQMNIQELQFIAREQLPIKVVIINNASLGMISHFQEMYFESNFVQTKKDHGYTTPEFHKIAYAYGLPYVKIERLSEINESIFNNSEPAIIEVILNENTHVFPKLAMNKPIQDQEPLIDRKLYDYLTSL